MRNRTRFLVGMVDEALKRRGSDVISVDYNEVTGMIDINECHHSWSDVLFSSVVSARAVNKDELVEALNKRGVGRSPHRRKENRNEI